MVDKILPGSLLQKLRPLSEPQWRVHSGASSADESNFWRDCRRARSPWVVIGVGDFLAADWLKPSSPATLAAAANGAGGNRERFARAWAEAAWSGIADAVAALNGNRSALWNEALDVIIADQAIRDSDGSLTPDAGDIHRQARQRIERLLADMTAGASSQLRYRYFKTGRVTDAADRGPTLILVEQIWQSPLPVDGERLSRFEARIGEVATAAVLALALQEAGLTPADLLSPPPGETAESWTKFGATLAASPECLVVVSSSGHRALHLAGGASTRSVAEAHALRRCDPNAPDLAVRLVLGRYAGSCEYWLTADSAAPSGAARIDEAADRLLDMLLTGNRPVARWRTSFFVPVSRAAICGSANGPPAATLLSPNDHVGKPERDYFLPHLSRLWGDLSEGNANDTLKTFAIYTATTSGASLYFVRVTHPLYGDMDARLTRVRYHRFGNDRMKSDVLEYELASQNELAVIDSEAALTLAGAQADWSQAQVAIEQIFDNEISQGEARSPWLWRRYLSDVARPWSLAKLTDFLAEARFIDHAYPHEAHVRADRVPIMLSLHRDDQPGSQVELAKLPSNGNTNWINMLLATGGCIVATAVATNGDDRAKVLTSIILEGGQPWESRRLDPELSRINMVDPWGSGYFYPAGVAQADLAASSYGRFWEYGSHLMITDHSFSFVGFRHHAGLQNSQFSFSERFIHMAHMQTMYARIFLVALFQQFGLSDMEVAAGSRGDWRTKIDEIAKLRENYVDFVSERWFVNISSQLQGRELYLHMRRQFGLEDDLALVDAKIRDLETIVVERDKRASTQAAERHQATQKLIEDFALPVVVLLGLRSVIQDNDHDFTVSIFQPIDELAKAGFGNHFLIMCAIAWIISSTVLGMRSAFEVDLYVKQRQNLSFIRKFIAGFKYRNFLIIVALILAAMIFPPFKNVKVTAQYSFRTQIASCHYCRKPSDYNSF